MPLPPALDLMPRISREASNDNSVKVAKAQRDELVKRARDLLDNPPAPATSYTSKQWWQFFMRNFGQAYFVGNVQGANFYDVEGMQLEMDLLLQDDYVDGVKQGIYPPPKAKPFVNYVPSTIQNPDGTTAQKGGMWPGLRVWAEKYRELSKTFRSQAK